MKRLLSVLAIVALLASMCGFAAAAEQKDYSVEGWYRVYSITPEDHDYSYIYDRPSSSQGKNLGRVDDDEYVYVTYKTEGTGKQSSEWAYCEYGKVKGYIRYENLVYTGSYRGGTTNNTSSYDDVEGWYVVYSIVPENHDYSYIYDQPSSTQGKNLCRVDDYEYVYVYWTEQGTGKKDSVWAYCDYDGVSGYIRYENLMPAGE